MAFIPWLKWIASFSILAVLLGFGPTLSRGETGYDAWLRYSALSADDAPLYASLPDSIVVHGDSAIATSARSELSRGVKGLLGKALNVKSDVGNEGAILLVTRDGAKS